jgi:hypothetical protein
VGWGRIIGKMEEAECTNWLSVWQNVNERAGRKRRITGPLRYLNVILGRDGNEIISHVGKAGINYYPPIKFHRWLTATNNKNSF